MSINFGGKNDEVEACKVLRPSRLVFSVCCCIISVAAQGLFLHDAHCLLLHNMACAE